MARLTQAQLARELGLSPAAIVALKRRGMPVHDVEAARRWRAAHVGPYTRTSAAAAPAAVQAAPDGTVPNLNTERALLARSQREAQDLKNAILRGQFAPISLLTEVLAAVGAEFSQRLEALPSEVRKRCPELPAEALDALAEALAAGRNAMADALEQVAARAAAAATYQTPDVESST